MAANKRFQGMNSSTVETRFAKVKPHIVKETLTTMTCKGCNARTVYCREKKQSKALLFCCDTCKKQWSGHIPAGHSLTSTFRRRDIDARPSKVRLQYDRAGGVVLPSH